MHEVECPACQARRDAGPHECQPRGDWTSRGLEPPEGRARVFFPKPKVSAGRRPRSDGGSRSSSSSGAGASGGGGSGAEGSASRATAARRPADAATAAAAAADARAQPELERLMALLQVDKELGLAACARLPARGGARGASAAEVSRRLRLDCVVLLLKMATPARRRDDKVMACLAGLVGSKLQAVLNDARLA
jgi:hypothetical protein